MQPRSIRLHRDYLEQVRRRNFESRAGRDAHAKLVCLVFALEALGEADGAADVTADVLLPRAAACVAEARVPHLHAELAFVEAFARDGFLGVEGYALATLRSALIMLAAPEDAAAGEGVVTVVI